jgi:hypothetical protein
LACDTAKKITCFLVDPASVLAIAEVLQNTVCATLEMWLLALLN